jgi:hypothetical protein
LIVIWRKEGADGIPCLEQAADGAVDDAPEVNPIDMSSLEEGEDFRKESERFIVFPL